MLELCMSVSAAIPILPSNKWRPVQLVDTLFASDAFGMPSVKRSLARAGDEISTMPVAKSNASPQCQRRAVMDISRKTLLNALYCNPKVGEKL